MEHQESCKGPECRVCPNIEEELSSDEEKKESLIEKYWFNAVTGVTGVLLVTAWILKFAGLYPDFVLYASLAAALIGGIPIASNALKALQNKELSADMLVTIAAAAAIIIGDYIEAATVVFILILGEFLETLTVNRASSALRGLRENIPDRVRLKKHGQEIIVKSESLKVGDVFIVKSGERIPVDGVVVAGESSLDQASVTGESTPVHKKVGDEVFAGTMNLLGALEIKATKVGKDTTVSRIERLILDAQQKKARIQRTVDHYTTYYVPVVSLVALATYFYTGDIKRAITILIVSCPCAFILGTPTAIIAAIGAAAKKGIVIKGGNILEAAGRITAVVFDKTGTITSGTPRVTEFKSFNGFPGDYLLKMAAIAEKRSEHPFGLAIYNKAREEGLDIPDPEEFKVYMGMGVAAMSNGVSIAVGNRSLMERMSIPILPKMRKYLKAREYLGETGLLVAINNEVCGILCVADAIKADSSEAIHILKSQKMDCTCLLTGDNRRIAEAVAKKVGVERVWSDLLPEEKVKKVEELKKQGHRVAMVGDGINDAAALAASHVGIAMGHRGSELAAESADIVILNDELKKVPQVLSLGRRTLSVIKQNLGFAILYNIAMIGLAALGVITMIQGAFLHLVSSMAVILNSMRLLRL
ncbi:heavy metal translocating P-type ATPase [Candidatus Pyrohabitans sp.]